MQEWTARHGTLISVNPSFPFLKQQSSAIVMQGRSVQKSRLTEAGAWKSAGKEQFRNFPATHELIPKQHCWHSPSVKSSHGFLLPGHQKPILAKNTEAV